MGEAYSVYSVDLAKLAGAWGSGNARLAKAIVTKQADRFTDNRDWFADDIAAGAPTLAQALEQILAGKPASKAHGFQYGYALEQLCAHLGKRVHEGSLRSAHALDKLLAKAKQPKISALLGTGGEVRGWLARATKAKRQLAWFIY